MDYIGAVSGITINAQNPCAVYYREHTLYKGYIYKIKIDYQEN